MYLRDSVTDTFCLEEDDFVITCAVSVQADPVFNARIRTKCKAHEDLSTRMAKKDVDPALKLDGMSLIYISSPSALSWQFVSNTSMAERQPAGGGSLLGTRNSRVCCCALHILL